MSTLKKAWFVDYGTKEWDHCYLVIHCEDRKYIKNILKRHFANSGIHDFQINRVAEWESGQVPYEQGIVVDEEGGDVYE